MADRFVDFETKICADWLNTVDDAVVDALGSPSTPTEARDNIGAIGEAPQDGTSYARVNASWQSVGSGLTHNGITGRDAADAHPQSAITGLETRLTSIESKNTSQDAAIALKADKTYVDGQLALKADITYVDAENSAQDAVIATKLNDAPIDGTPYNRLNGAWAAAAGGFPDAPSDGVAYGRRNAAWENLDARFAPISRPNGNFLINGDMAIWQRGVGPFNVAAGGNAYTADRWFLFANQQPQVARFVAFGTSGVVVGQTGIEQALQIDNPPAGAYFSLVQHVEDPAQFNGRLLTFSFYSNRLITPATSCIAQINFGTGGSTALNLSPTALVAEEVPGTTHFRNRCTIQVPVLAGYTFGTGPFLLIGMQSVPPTGGFGGNVNVYGFKLENGGVMTDFERRPRGEELALCQRYYYVDDVDATGQAFTTSQAVVAVRFPVTMRIPPVWVPTTVPGSAISPGGASFPVTSLDNPSMRTGGARYTITAAVGWNSGMATIHYDKILRYSAEFV